ncbi:MAG: HAMP domain-containing sensor histidine kinase [Clostridia bacterium]|nr:HAMP domain-containing sensor histidine kinase [Clostridia bacterium]MDD4047789.1 HAMP domain-containing sensor histidine kinase [Clostridia bacterium]
MKNKQTLSINNLYIWIICIVSLLLLSAMNIYFIQKSSQEKEHNIIEYEQQINAQKDMLEKGMMLMFNNVYMQRSWIEDILNNPSTSSSTGVFQDRIKYNSKLDVSSLNFESDNSYKKYGNVIVDGDINSKDMHFLGELDKIKKIFEVQHYLNKNSIFESWSTYYSEEGYITIYPFEYANEIISDKDEVFNLVKESIGQLNDMDDPDIYKKGWETDIFLDNKKNVIMFSKYLPVQKQNKITGIVANNISIDELSSYINQNNYDANIYLVDSSQNIVYKNGELVKDIELFSMHLEQQYNINNSFDLFENQNPQSMNGYYFFVSPLDNVNWKLIYTVNLNKIESGGVSRVLVVITTNLMIITIAIILINILKRKIEELNKIENLKAEFLMTVSHDLKAPLVSIIGFTEMIQKKFDRDILPEMTGTESSVIQKTVNRIHRNFSIIKEEGARLTHMINNLLDLSKLESEEVCLGKDNIDPYCLAQEAFEKTSSILDVKGLKYKIISHPNLPDFIGDRGKLLQVLINVISNAVKFTEQGDIYCDIKISNEMIVFAIKDTGVGIPKSSQYQIFDKFYRCDYKNVQQKKGSGLGLAICKNIVHLHRGIIWVESEEEKGSTFFISIPVK